MVEPPTDETAKGAGQTLSELSGQVFAATFSRLIINTARRFPYPFAPVLSRGMQVPLTAVTGLIAINQITALLALLFGPIADRFGYRMMMLGGMGLLVIGMFAGGLMPVYGVILVAFFLAGLGKNVFDPALQAYVGHRVPYHRRARVIGILETCWAGSTLVGIPLVALLIDRLGWRSPFFVLGGLGLFGWFSLWHLLQKEPARVKDGENALGTNLLTMWNGMRGAWAQLRREKAALGALGFAFFASAGNDNLFVVYGAWLEQSFGMGIVAIGVGTTVIGAAELTGEVLTATFSDRLGLSRSVVAGLALNTVSYLLLPFIGQSTVMALVGLFLVFLTMEFTIVSALSFCTEVVPGARATMMSAFMAAAGLGRVVGALIGGPVWLAGGMVSTAAVSAMACALGLGAMVYGIRARGRSMQ